MKTNSKEKGESPPEKNQKNFQKTLDKKSDLCYNKDKIREGKLLKTGKENESLCVLNKQKKFPEILLRANLFEELNVRKQLATENFDSILQKPLFLSGHTLYLNGYLTKKAIKWNKWTDRM